jgi:outer membrane immunogenic protein
MRKFLLTTSALVAMAASASAADLPVKAPPPAPPPAPVYSWNGIYIGIMGGYGFSDRLGVSVAGFDFSVASGDLRGGFVGGTIGYNYQFAGSPIVIGLEADGAWANINASRSATALGVTATLEDRIDALGSVTGRLGYAWGPGLLYVKGGWAWADNRVTATLAAPALVVSASESHVHSGWTIGGGIEYLFLPRWSGKIEYMFADYGSATYGGNLIAGGFGLSATVHTIKGGINYHFDWGGGSPVVARY